MKKGLSRYGKERASRGADEFTEMFRHDEEIMGNVRDDEICTRCGSENDVQPRYSFGAYAGRLCRKCAMTYRDHCGMDQGQGDWRDLDEPYWED